MLSNPPLRGAVPFALEKSMKSVSAHVTRCVIAGIVALLPIGGLVLTVVWLEQSIAASWMSRQPWYFPGMGILAAFLLLYAIGLTVTSLLGRWAWNRFDRSLHRLPLLGQLYATLKQIVGYGDGPDAIFKSVVFIHNGPVAELGLVTASVTDPRGVTRLTLFLPGAPTPTSGRLLVIDAALVTPTTLSVSEALKALVSVGISPRLTDVAVSK
jgi:uncharacterized membrane protein